KDFTSQQPEWASDIAIADSKKNTGQQSRPMPLPAQPAWRALGCFSKQHAEKQSPEFTQDATRPRQLSSAARRRQNVDVIDFQIRFARIGAFAQQSSQICGLVMRIADSVKQKRMTSYSERCAQRRSLSLRSFVPSDYDMAITSDQFLGQFAGGICAAVVHHDQLILAVQTVEERDPGGEQRFEMGRLIAREQNHAYRLRSNRRQVGKFRHNSEVRGQKSEVRSQKSEVRS